ncbi:Amino Acid/Auxin Permease (AAAP) Family [Thraustotheca clavata]|uniref:Amino Acid/Auxin Permease (AAAP) Family n=1 Tax=Thraustotheca clavata TaxID=74557 RepID=A0A1W0A7W5_9STRA|nr:Amino Acid/Auxin Permease (AAAP) Family [Thraustotheca clavata]
MFGLVLVWNIIAAIVDYRHESTPATSVPEPTLAELTAPPTTVATIAPILTIPTNNITLNATVAKVLGNIKLPIYTALSPVPTVKSCPPGRQVKPGETVYMTVDDGPSEVGRQNLLEVLDQINQKVTFFESSYNLCGPETKFEQTQSCIPQAKSKVAELSVWTIKKGHMLAAHSDTHYYNADTSVCDYAKMSVSTKIDNKYASCGREAIQDMVRGALMYEEVWKNDTYWDTKEEIEMYNRQWQNMWTFARLPCTDLWRLPHNHYKDVIYGGESSPEKALRTGIADQMVGGGPLNCKNSTFQGRPWAVFGWDVEWQWNAKQMNNLQDEKCRIVQAIEKNFDSKNKDQGRRHGVVVLAHDFHYSSKQLAAMFRDAIVELKLRGYNINTVDNYRLSKSIYCPMSTGIYRSPVTKIGEPIMAFLTLEDLKLCFNLYCVVYGIGTLGMPGNYARAGYAWATVALLLMAAINLYTTVLVSKVMLAAPKYVRTYGDIGEWLYGKPGRYITTLSQLLVCCMVPIAFLVLGGSLLDVLFPDTFSAQVWIVLMAITLLPICMMPSLKESAGTAAAGALGTLFADFVALYVLLHYMGGVPEGLSPPKPALSFDGVTSVFGNLSLGYSAGVVIPALQREHSRPERMPRVILVTLGFCSVLFLIISIAGVHNTGCQIPGNLLFAITGSKLGFTAPRGGIVLAFLFMQLHCTVAFAVILFPTFYIFERIIFGFHKEQFTLESRENNDFEDLETPAIKDDDKPSLPAAAEDKPIMYASNRDYMKACIMRFVQVSICTVIAIIWKDHFNDLLNFVGASSTALGCMILPVLFNLKAHHKTMGIFEKICSAFILIVIIFLAIYVSIQTGKALFTPTESDPTILFPYCPAEFYGASIWGFHFSFSLVVIMGTPFMTMEDIKTSFSLFCVVCGIGTLSMPGNYARAGYIWATIATIFMASINIYASVCISKLMLVAPKTVKTLGDIGGWVFGTPGRISIVIGHMLVCTMAPIMFLVLGGAILTTLFPDSFSDTTWIILMTVSLLPVCLVPTLHESAGQAAAGAIGIILADGIAIYLLIDNITVPSGISPPSPDITLSGVTTAFGSLSLAYAAGIIIPSLQREHSQPSRMPRVIVITLVVVSAFFLLVSILGDYKIGCQIPGNLLFAITGTKLSFNASRGGIILAYIFMYLHIVIAFALVLFPAMFLCERIVLGLHKTENLDLEHIEVETPKDDAAVLNHVHDETNDAYKAPGAYIKAAVLRTIMVALCCVIAILFKDKFGDLLDFVGASATSTSCMILPMIFYLKVFFPKLSAFEKGFAIISIIVTSILAVYVSIKTGISLFSPSESTVQFPFCPEKYQHTMNFIRFVLDMFVSADAGAILRDEVAALREELNKKNTECIELRHQVNELEQKTLDQSVEIKDLELKISSISIAHDQSLNLLNDQLSTLQGEKMDQDVSYLNLKMQLDHDRKKHAEAKIFYDQEINSMQETMTCISELYTQHLKTCGLNEKENDTDPKPVVCTVDKDQIVNYFHLVNDLKKKILIGVGALVVVAAAATAIAVTVTKSGSDSTSNKDGIATTTPVTIPVTTAAPVTSLPIITASPTPVVKQKVAHNIKMPAAPPATDIPSKPTCQSSRNANPGDTVFMTIDDGPSIKGRMNLLTVLAQINQTISFFESSYNFCGPETFYEQTLQCQDPSPYATVTDLFAYTIKQGHFLAAHSDTHFYNNASALCEYATMDKRTKIDPQYESCGNTPVADMVRGALRIQTALNNDSLWDTDQEYSLYQQAMTNIWTYARLPCTSAWRMNNYKKTTMLGGPDAPPPEAKARNDVADTMFTGTMPCRNETFQGKPWMTIGWDVEWGIDRKTKALPPKCTMFKVIEDNFAWGGRDQQRKQEVVKKKIWLGVGALVIVAAAATAIAVSMTKSGSNTSSSTLPDNASSGGTNKPLPTSTSSSPSIVIKEKKVNNIQLPKAPPATDIPTKPTCPSSRNAVPGDTVFMTIDDGPSVKGRMNLLMALAQINQTISFFESSYNFCGPETFYEQSLQCVEPSPYHEVTDLFAYTIKQGHFLAAHSDTHYYDNVTALCEYATIEKRTKIDPQYESCGNTPVEDMVRGALRIQTALNNDTLWDNDQEYSLYQQAMTNIWTYARLPCTSAWRLPNYSKTTLLGGKDAAPEESKARNDVADTMFSGSVPCRNETYQGKPWMTIGWDVEWRWQSLTDMEAAKCSMFKTIEGNFAWSGRDQQRKQEVVVLGHDYHYDTSAKSKMYRDLIVELKLHGYKMDTVNNLKIYNLLNIVDTYFIDVNPKAFEAVLDYLRYDELCLDDMTTWERKKVLKTFAYLKLPVPNVGWDPSTGVISTRNGFSPGATI